MGNQHVFERLNSIIRESTNQVQQLTRQGRWDSPEYRYWDQRLDAALKLYDELLSEERIRLGELARG